MFTMADLAFQVEESKLIQKKGSSWKRVGESIGILIQNGGSMQVRILSLRYS